jgi:hypothetical protein
MTKFFQSKFLVIFISLSSVSFAEDGKTSALAWKPLLSVKVNTQNLANRNSQFNPVFRPDGLTFLKNLSQRAKKTNMPQKLYIDLTAGAQDRDFSSFESMAQLSALLMRTLTNLGWRSEQIQVSVNALSSPLAALVHFQLKGQETNNPKK